MLGVDPEEAVMGVRLRDLLGGRIQDLRYEPVTKRVRAEVGGALVADTQRAVLVWEPRRVVPTYAVPVEDLHGELVPDGGAPPEWTGDRAGFAVPDVTALPVLDPRIPFGVRLTDGDRVRVRTGGGEVEGFRPADPALAGYVVLDFDGADRWFEEDEPIGAHPRDPFHRVDVRASSRHVRLRLDGELLADSARPALVFETMLPVRYYLPREDVAVLLLPSDTRTECAYKGAATYWSAEVAGRVVPDLAWSYPDPLPDAAPLRGLVAFFDERLDVEVDGVPRPRAVTPWSRP
jgi:uncharacterized protein (DUF427 family)